MFARHPYFPSLTDCSHKSPKRSFILFDFYIWWTNRYFCCKVSMGNSYFKWTSIVFSNIFIHSVRRNWWIIVDSIIGDTAVNFFNDSKSYLSGLPWLSKNLWSYFGGFFLALFLECRKVIMHKCFKCSHAWIPIPNLMWWRKLNH